jgi:iron complex transport system substrate-binding protein
VSLAPSVTEVLFELGLGDRLSGVSRYDRFPPAVEALPRVGGLFDPAIERIVALKPSLVVALVEFGEKASYLRTLGLVVETVDHRSVGGILASLDSLGARCGVAGRAGQVRARLERAIATVRSQTAEHRPVRTLVVVGAGSLGGARRSVFVSGRDGFYDELIELAGGVNVVTGKTVEVPTVSAEGLLALDPEVIIEVLDRAESPGISAAEIEGSWRELATLRAVRAGRVHVVSDDYATIPGPRFVSTLERFAALLEPVSREGVR